MRTALAYFCLIMSILEVIAMYYYQFTNPHLTQTELFFDTWPIAIFIGVQLWAFYKLIDDTPNASPPKAS